MAGRLQEANRPGVKRRAKYKVGAFPAGNSKKMIIDIDKYGRISNNEAARRSWQAKGI
jgi:hypothetical protein